MLLIKTWLKLSFKALADCIKKKQCILYYSTKILVNSFNLFSRIECFCQFSLNATVQCIVYYKQNFIHLQILTIDIYKPKHTKPTLPNWIRPLICVDQNNRLKWANKAFKYKLHVSKSSRKHAQMHIVLFQTMLQITQSGLCAVQEDADI